MNGEHREVWIPVEGGVHLEGALGLPPGARGVVVFAQGAGSSRFSPRNRFVAEVLQRAGLATVLFDLLTGEEEEKERFTRHLRVDIELLTGRLLAATHWVMQQPGLRELAIGYFGSSTGSAAALVAAARESGPIRAIVSRGGRPDLAGEAVSRVQAPTLLIVGEGDEPIIELSQEALGQLRSEKRLELVAGATHFFDEPGTLERVAELAAEWFVRHLGAQERPSAEGSATR
ncbi:MAG: dienelactone hydrolase family protein [Myxococcaceae bacterium]